MSSAALNQKVSKLEARVRELEVENAQLREGRPIPATPQSDGVFDPKASQEASLARKREEQAAREAALSGQPIEASGAVARRELALTEEQTPADEPDPNTLNNQAGFTGEIPIDPGEGGEDDSDAAGDSTPAVA